MFFPRAYTIIVATQNCVARVDLQAGKSVRVARAQARTRPAHSALADAVAGGLSQGPAKCGRLYILSDELFCGQVALDDQIVAAIEPERLEQTLALESEYASGMSPFASRLGHVIANKGDGQTHFCITQMETSQLAELTAALPEWAAPIAGIAAIESLETDVDRNAPQISTAWDVDRCQALAQRWLTQLLQSDHRAPLICLQSQRWDPQHRRQVGIAAAIATILLCTALHVWDSRRLVAANEAWSSLQQTESQLRSRLDQQEQLARQIREQAAERQAQLQAEAERRQQQQKKAAQVDALRQRPNELLQSLADTADQGHWIQSIQYSSQQVVIIGVAIDSTAVTSLTQRLEAQLPASRWRIQPAQISAATPATLVRFELTLLPHDEPLLPTAAVADRGGADVR